MVKEDKAWRASIIDVKPVRTWNLRNGVNYDLTGFRMPVLGVRNQRLLFLERLRNGCWLSWRSNPAGPTIRGNCEKGDEDELTSTFVAVFLLILLFLADIFKE